MALREGHIEAKVNEYAESLGWRQRKIEYISHRGCPDRIFFRDGVIVFIEFKNKNGRLSDHQKSEVNWLGANGFRIFVVDSIERGVEVFDQLEEEHPVS